MLTDVRGLRRRSRFEAQAEAGFKHCRWLGRYTSNVKRCDEKIRYRTAAGANWALWRIWMSRYLGGRSHRRERRAYACPHCTGWHLTSQSKRR